jgi:prepilin-type N-terminal cleavage/methylation domain-containing protein/prepilin-type processing-associated H-X9-DG protein
MKRHRLERRHHPAKRDGRNSRLTSTPGGFSLIELLAVIAIILILTMLMWGGRGRGRQRQQQKSCQTYLQKVFLAMEIYSRDSAGNFPFLAGAKTSEEALDLLVPRYTVDTGSFVCPGSKDSAPASGEPLARHKISYAYYMGRRASDASDALMSDEQVDTLARAAGQPAFSANGKGPGNNHPKAGGNFLFVDGRVEHTPARPRFSLMLTQGVVLLNPKP